MTMAKSTIMKILQLLAVTCCLLISSYTLAAATVTVDKKTAETIKLAEEAFDKSDIISAINHYRTAAEAGYGPAMTRLAYLLDKSENNEEAIQWLKKAVALGEAEAQFELARMYAYGEGIKQDKAAALELFMQSAKQDFAPAVRVLALAYEKGDLGLRIDYELSQQWLQHGQQINDYWSIKRLASAYRDGNLGLRINREKAQQLELLLEQSRR